MKPIIYRNTDHDAPVLSQHLGTMNTLLKACLVTGYGDKPAAGWEIAYENTAEHKLALRSKNPMSEQAVLLLHDTQTIKADVTAYKHWAGDAGSDQWGSGAFWKRWGTGYDPAYWVVIATDTFFYIWIQTELNKSGMGKLDFFGDAISLRNDMSFAVLAAAPRSVSYDESGTGLSSINTSHNKKAQFPRSLFPTFNQYWGDRSDGQGGSNAWASQTTIFARFALYVELDGRKQPVLELPGALMPYSEIWGRRTEGEVARLDNQVPYQEPLVGLYQPWHGRMWLQVDDWSAP